MVLTIYSPSHLPSADRLIFLLVELANTFSSNTVPALYYGTWTRYIHIFCTGYVLNMSFPHLLFNPTNTDFRRWNQEYIVFNYWFKPFLWLIWTLVLPIILVEYLNPYELCICSSPPLDPLDEWAIHLDLCLMNSYSLQVHKISPLYANYPQ